VISDGAGSGSVLERGREAGDAELARRADWIRLKTVGLIAQAGLGHYSSTFSCAEIIATLYYSVLRLDPAFPGLPAELYEYYGLTVAGVAAAIRELLVR
jgi:transketolase